MADRLFSDVQACQKEVKVIFGSFTVDSDGAATAVTPMKGWSSVVRDGADSGEYYVYLDSKYKSLLFAEAVVLKSTACAAPIVQVFGSYTTGDAPYVKFLFLDKDGAVADPDSSTVHFRIVLSNSEV